MYQQANLLDSADIDRKSRGSLLATPGIAPSWFPDTANCMLCDKRFNTRIRRHHCRACGYCVCNFCAPTFSVLPNTTKPVRVCKQCVSDLHLSGNEQVDNHNGGTSTNTGVSYPTNSNGHNMERDFAEIIGIVDVPAWTYLVRPFSSLGRKVRIGRISIRLLQMSNVVLPGGTCTSEDTIIIEPVQRIGNNSVKTPTVDLGKVSNPLLLNANIDKGILVDVDSHEQTLQLQFSMKVIDHNGNSTSIPLGYTPLDVDSLLQSSGKLRLQLDILGNTEETRKNKPQIEVEVQGGVNKLGYYWSQFFPMKEDTTSTSNTAHTLRAVELDNPFSRPPSATHSVRDFLFLLHSISPLQAGCDLQYALINCTNPILPILAAIVCLAVVYAFPNVFVLYLQLSLMKFIVSKFLMWRSGEMADVESVKIQQLQDLFPDQNKAKKELSQEQTSTDLLQCDFIEGLITSIAPLVGLHNIRYVDALQVKANSSILKGHNLLSWSNPYITAMILLLTVVSFMLTILGYTAYVVQGYGLAVLFWNTALFTAIFLLFKSKAVSN